MPVADIFTNMQIPQLGDVNFQTNFQNFCSAIVENIQRLISVQYVKGEAGSSVMNRDVVVTYDDEPLSPHTHPTGPLCPLGQALVETIFEPNTQPEDWTIGSVSTWLDGQVAPMIGENVVWPALTRDYNINPQQDTYNVVSGANVIEVIEVGLGQNPVNQIHNAWKYDGVYYDDELVVESYEEDTQVRYKIICDGTIIISGLTENPSNDITDAWEYDNEYYDEEVKVIEIFGDENQIKVSINIDEESHKAYLANPFILIDGRIVSLKDLTEEDLISLNFLDCSTAVYGTGEYTGDSGQIEDDPTTWTWTLHRVNIIPKLYYDPDVSEFCWNINGQQTGITAQGLTGDAGQSIKTWIARGDCSGSMTNPDYFRIKKVLDEDNFGQIIWTDPETRNIGNNDLGLVYWLYDGGDWPEDPTQEELDDLMPMTRVYFGSVRKINGEYRVKYVHNNDIFESYDIHSFWRRMWSIDMVVEGHSLTDLPSPARGYVIPDTMSVIEPPQEQDGIVPCRSHMIWNYAEPAGENTYHDGILMSSPIDLANWVQTHSGINRNSSVQMGGTGNWTINYNTNVQGNSCVQGNHLVQGNGTVQGNVNVQGTLEVNDLTRITTDDNDNLPSFQTQGSACGKVNGLYGVYLGVPIGTIVMWPTDNIPEGWLLCDGHPISSSSVYVGDNNPEYQRLINILNPGARDFAYLPDFGARFPLGAKIQTETEEADFGYPTRLGDTGGEEKHQLTIAEMPEHYHIEDLAGDHSHTFGNSFYNGSDNFYPVGKTDGSDHAILTDYSSTISGKYHLIPHNTDDSYYTIPELLNSTMSTADAHAHTIRSTGGGAAHNNIPPFYAINFIIKYK